MKIVDFKTFVVANPPPHFGGKYWVFVKLITDNNIIGYGEVYAVPFHPSVVVKMVEDVCARLMVGEDPFHIERNWRRAYSRGFNQRTDVSMMSVFSGIETACWDIIGKAVDKPIYELLGGQVHARLRSYSYLYPSAEYQEVYSNPEQAAAVAATYKQQGFTAVKFDPVGPYSAFDPRQLSLESLRRSENFVRILRESVGDGCDLLFGTHGQMTPSSAIRLAKRLEPYDPLWLEEPVPPDNAEAMSLVARSTSIPIATGERLSSKYDFAQILRHQAASILQPALGHCGGILEAKKIAALAEANYCQIAPHLYCGPIEGVANIQLATCIPNFLILESIQQWGGFYSKLLTRPIQWEQGYVIPSSEPGLGTELNEDVANAHPYNGEELTLEMVSTPVI